MLGESGLKPALWAGGAAIALPTLGKDGAALAINQDGQLGGWVDTADGGTHAAIWSNRRLIDVGSVRNAPTIATAINVHGEVAGRADLAHGTDAVALLELKRLGSGPAGGSMKLLGHGRGDAPPGLR